MPVPGSELSIIPSVSGADVFRVGRSFHVLLALLCVLGGAALAQDVPDTLEVERNLATQLLKSGKYTRAIEAFKKVLAKQPGDADGLRGISAALLKTDRTDEAIRYLEPLARDPARREIGDLLQLGGLYLKTNRKNDALRVANALGTQPGGARSVDLLDLANLWLDVGKPDRSRMILRKLPRVIQDSPRGLEIDADSTAALGEHARAAELYLKMAGPDRAILEPAWRFAEELDLSGDKDRAFAEVKRLLPRGASMPQLVFAAQLALDQKDVALAEKVVARIPDTVRTLDVELVRAEVKIARGDYLDAEVILERAFKIYPDSMELRRTLAPVLLELGSFERALTVFQPLLAGSPSLSDLKVASQIYRALGRMDDADRTYRELVRRRPAAAEAAHDLADFLVGELQGAHAISILRATDARGEDQPIAMTIHGAALLVMHATDGAVLGAVEPLFRRPVLTPTVGVRLADLMLDLGFPEKAVRALDLGRSPSRVPARAHVLRARALFRVDARRERALEHALKAMARLGESPPTQEIFELAEVFLELKSPELALKVIDLQRIPQIRQFAFDLLRARIHYLSLADIDNGEKLLRELVLHKSPSLTLDLDLASLLLEIHEIDTAIRFLDTLRATPEFSVRLGMLRAGASIRSREGRRAALERLEPLEELIGADPALAVDFAEALLEVPDRPRALKLLMSLDPPRRLAFRHKILLAQALIKLNDFKTVEQILMSIADRARIGPDRKATMIELALGLKELRAAEVLFEQLPAWWLDSQEGRRLIVNMDIARGRFDHALRLSRRLVHDRPADPNELNLQAQAHIGIRQYCEALALFDDLLRLIPDKEEFILGRSQSLRGLERNGEALRPHVELVKRYDRRGETPPIDFIVEAAECLDENKYAPSAAEYYRRALKFRPADPDYKKALAGTLSRLDEHQEAYALFKEAVTKPDKEDGVAAGGYLRELGSPARARQEFESSLRSDPDNLDAKRGLASILSERDATRRKGIALYRQVLQVKPDDHQTRALLASALAREKLYDDADFELEHTHVKKPRDRETRRVRSTLDIVHGYPAISERHLINMKYQERTDPEAEIGLSDVAANRGKGYLRDEVEHVLAARTLAPKRRAVVRRSEQLFLPNVAVDTYSESGTDTLERLTNAVRLDRLIDHDKEGSLILEQKSVIRRNIEVSGFDATGQLVWNCRPGSTASFGLVVGELGDDADFLPRLELRHLDLHGVTSALEYARLRVDDSPDALVAGLRSDTVRLIVGKEVGPVGTELTFRRDAISDGSVRRSLFSTIRYRPMPRLDLQLDLQYRNADRVPVPFDLYFSPLDYQLAQASFEYRSPRLSGYEFLTGGGVFADRLDEDRGTGVRARVRLERAMGALAGAFAGFEYLATSATRRLGVPESFSNRTMQAGYATRF